MQVSTIGVDLAKNVFQVHGVDSPGKVVISGQLRRKQVIEFFSKIPPCLVGMEACGTAHHWAREVSKLGHTVRLMPPSRSLPPVECCRGTSPIHAAKSRPDLKVLGSVTVEAMAVAPITPIPGTVSRRQLISLAR